MRRLLSVLLAIAPALLHAQDDDLRAQLEAIRQKHHLPALTALRFTPDGVAEQVTVGVRKAGTSVAATDGDLWHLGSDTKMMTAALAGTFVAEGKLAWDAPVVSYFPELAEKVPPAMREITVAQVLRHRAGLKDNLDWRTFQPHGGEPESYIAARRAAVEQALANPAYPVGAFHYSNTDYVVVGAILEKLSGQPWEKLMRERIFTPLGMASAGFGGTGTSGQIDQPWPHAPSGQPVAQNGPKTDNPEVMGPAGTVHCTAADWAKFLADQLKGGMGQAALLPPEVYRAIQTPPPGGDYAFGLMAVPRPWAGGTALTHNGSNTMNFATAWLAPQRGFGVLACANEGGDEASAACDEAISLLIRRQQAQAKEKAGDVMSPAS
jgi:CubicO group peptidase (beta-lactamase class C family)